MTPPDNGVASLDIATGCVYILCSEASVHTRFAGIPPNEYNADRFLIVRLSGSTWQYNTNLGNASLVPQDTDVMIASVDFADTITPWKARST